MNATAQMDLAAHCLGLCCDPVPGRGQSLDLKGKNMSLYQLGLFAVEVGWAENKVSSKRIELVPPWVQQEGEVRTDILILEHWIFSGR
jgi:hypothetical protein